VKGQWIRRTRVPRIEDEWDKNATPLNLNPPRFAAEGLRAKRNPIDSTRQISFRSEVKVEEV
jgi:hypothetical protein